MKSSDKNRAILAEAAALSWKASAFRKQFLSSPKETLAAGGMEIPADTAVIVLENTASVIYAVLPPIEGQAKYQSRIDQAVKQISSLPETVELRIVRDSARKSHVVIPATPAAVASGKLSDEELEHVAGGKSTVATQTNSVQTAETVTTEVQTTETTTSVAAEVEAVVVPCFIS